MARTPAFAVPTLVLPGHVLRAVWRDHGPWPGSGRGAGMSSPGMGVFGTMAPGLFGFGVSLAFEREYGLLTFKQALPTPPRFLPAGAHGDGDAVRQRHLLAAHRAGACSWPTPPISGVQAVEVFIVEVLGVLPFCAIGLFVGSMVSGQAAPAIVNVIYLPMAFLSGLWVPFQYLPVRCSRILRRCGLLPPVADRAARAGPEQLRQPEWSRRRPGGRDAAVLHHRHAQVGQRGFASVRRTQGRRRICAGQGVHHRDHRDFDRTADRRTPERT